MLTWSVVQWYSGVHTWSVGCLKLFRILAPFLYMEPQGCLLVAGQRGTCSQELAVNARELVVSTWELIVDQNGGIGEVMVCGRVQGWVAASAEGVCQGAEGGSRDG